MDSKKRIACREILQLNDSDSTAETLYHITCRANQGKTTWKAASFRTELADPHHFYAGYTIDDQLVGYIGSMLLLDEASINNFAVEPTYQGEGIGASLLEYFLNYCQIKEIKNVYLEVRFSNKKALDLYKRFGFKEIALRKGYYLDPVEDAFLFQLDMTERQAIRRV